MKSLLAIPFIFSFCLSFAQGQTSKKTLYYCSPCGCENDSKVLETGGKCLLCKMRLLEVGTYNYSMASVSHNGIIVYASNKINNENQLYYRKIDTDAKPSLIGEGTLPKISAQGDRIVFGRGDSGVFIFDVKTNTTMDLGEKINLPGAQSPSWNSDGKSIFFSAGKFPDIGLYQYNVETGKLSVLLEGNGLNYGIEPSPDGTKIAYRAARGKTKENMKRGIVVYDFQSKKEEFISNIGEYCTWSPDSKQLAFHWPDSSDFCIYTINADGTNLKTIAKVKGSDNELPSWSADGKKIFFQTNRRKGNWEIWTMNTDGSNQQPLVWKD